MADWISTMKQEYEYYVVDPLTWKDIRLIQDVKSCSISRDKTVDTLGSASISLGEDIGECYVRVYLIVIQNGVKERVPLATFLIQTPSTSFDGKVTEISSDAYTPLLELKETKPPIGYSLLKGENIMDNAYRIIREHARAPVVQTECSEVLFSDFVSNTDDTWMSFTSDLLSNARYEFDLDEMGRILFAPRQEITSLQPVWTYDDSNSSILYPEISISKDLYGIPNVVEVVFSSGATVYYSRAVNDDSNSPVSTVRRGREIVHRITDPDLSGEPTQAQIDEYAERMLREVSSLECTLSYSHGYCPVRVGDCVRLNYSRAGLEDVKAQVISQTIKCEPGCPVSEKAVFTIKYWR